MQPPCFCECHLCGASLRTYFKKQESEAGESATVSPREAQPPKQAKRIRVGAGCAAASSVAEIPSSSRPASSTSETDPVAIGTLAVGDWVLVNTSTFVVHHCVTSRCVTTACGRYLPFVSKVTRASKLTGHGYFSRALCFGKRWPLLCP